MALYDALLPDGGTSEEELRAMAREAVSHGGSDGGGDGGEAAAAGLTPERLEALLHGAEIDARLTVPLDAIHDAAG